MIHIANSTGSHDGGSYLAKGLFGMMLTITISLMSPVNFAQERWFQIEVSIFSNDNPSDRSQEFWLPDAEGLQFPDSMQRLQNLLDILLIEALMPAAESEALMDSDDTALSAEPISAQVQAQRQRAEAIARVGPPPATSGGGFKFSNFDRDAFLHLPTAQSDFQQTNRALDRSPEHRLLWHGLWRQPVLDPGFGTPLYVSGGQQFGDYHELMGSIEIRFNEGRDRVVLDADVWLSEFSNVEPEEQTWELPLPPAGFGNAAISANTVDDSARNTEPEFEYFPAQVYRMQQAREMRSTEFHYLDHPALGIVVTVDPYERPAAPPPGFSSLQSDLEDFSSTPQDQTN